MEERKRKMDDLVETVKKLKEEKDTQELEYKVSISNYKSLLDQVQILRDRNSNLKIEKSILNESYNRSELLNKQLQQQVDTYKRMYAEASVLYNQSEVENAGIKQLKKENEERVKEMRQQFKQMQQQRDYYQKVYNRLQIMFDELQREYRQIKDTVEEVDAEYGVVTQVRLGLEKEMQILKEKLKEVEREYGDVKKQRNEFRDKMKECERSIELKEDKHQGIEHMNTSKIEVLQSTVKELQTDLEAEKEIVTKWMTEYEKVKKSSEKYEIEVLDLKSDLKQAEVMIANLESSLKEAVEESK